MSEVETTARGRPAGRRPTIRAAVAPTPRWAGVWISRLRTRPVVVACAVLLLLLGGIALIAPWLPLPDPTMQSPAHRLAPPVWYPASLGGHPLGTDQLGRDVLSRMVYGTRVSLALALACAVLSCLIGVPLGLAAGLRPRYFGESIMAIADVLLAFPFLVLAIAITAVAGSSLPILVIVLAAFGWVQFARLVRGEVLSLREREFVEAARATGASGLKIAQRHILPHVLSPVIVIFTFTLATIILTESALSFLGLGVQPPTPTWGSMLADGRGYLDSAWWIGTFPGLALMATILAVSLLGDGLRDLLDPRMRL
jgi:peptide/nickel transport system permease protein